LGRGEKSDHRNIVTGKFHPTASSYELPIKETRDSFSVLQLVTIKYAFQQHERKLPDGLRAGYFNGDGPGVGKGRAITGIILENH
jgi:hypothetical protein